MYLDARGLTLSTTSAKAAAAFDYLVAGYLTQRADTPTRLTALLEADPDFALAHCMQGYFAMLAFKQASVPTAVEAARTARSVADDATERERGHVAALTAWSEGELDRALAVWESILRSHPLDAVAFRLAHFVNFWLGRPQDMVASVDRVVGAFRLQRDGIIRSPRVATVLGCAEHFPEGRPVVIPGVLHEGSQGGMDTDDALAIRHVIQERLLPFRVFEEHTARVVEADGVELGQFRRSEAFEVVVEHSCVRTGRRPHHIDRQIGVGDGAVAAAAHFAVTDIQGHDEQCTFL